MRIEANTDEGTLTVFNGATKQDFDLYSREGFEALSELWLKVGWAVKYPYCFSWMGRPIIQNPEDVLRMQEVIYSLKPDYIVETGVAHGGSLIFYASLFEAMGHGRVIGVDVEIRPHNRKAIEEHPLFHRIELIEGSSVAPETVADVKRRIPEGARVLVVLDSNHTKAHVAAELECYHDLVCPGSYIVATDGIMSLVHDAPRGQREWSHDNPTEAAKEFAASHPDFIIGEPKWPFNESELRSNITHWPGAWLRRVPS